MGDGAGEALRVFLWTTILIQQQPPSQPSPQAYNTFSVEETIFLKAHPIETTAMFQ